MGHSVTHSLSEWQGHLLSCQVTAKNIGGWVCFIWYLKYIVDAADKTTNSFTIFSWISKVQSQVFWHRSICYFSPGIFLNPWCSSPIVFLLLFYLFNYCIHFVQYSCTIVQLYYWRLLAFIGRSQTTNTSFPEILILSSNPIHLKHQQV